MNKYAVLRNIITFSNQIIVLLASTHDFESILMINIENTEHLRSPINQLEVQFNWKID